MQICDKRHSTQKSEQVQRPLGKITLGVTLRRHPRARILFLHNTGEVTLSNTKLPKRGSTGTKEISEERGKM